MKQRAQFLTSFDRGRRSPVRPYFRTHTSLARRRHATFPPRPNAERLRGQRRSGAEAGSMSANFTNERSGANE